MNAVLADLLPCQIGFITVLVVNQAANPHTGGVGLRAQHGDPLGSRLPVVSSFFLGEILAPHRQGDLRHPTLLNLHLFGAKVVFFGQFLANFREETRLLLLGAQISCISTLVQSSI
jgi:hypothetical protein